MNSTTSQLTKYLERLAVFLKDNRPSYVQKYNVTVSTFKTGDDTHCIRLNTSLYISEAVLKDLDQTGVIEK